MNSLAPPHQLVYPSLEEAKAAIYAYAHLGGYVFVVKLTIRIGNKKDGDVKAVILVCSQSNPSVIRQVPNLASVCRLGVALAVCSPPVYDEDKLEIRWYIVANLSPIRLPIRTGAF